MSEASGLINSILLVAKANGLFWPVVIVCSAFFAFLLWLVLREARLWYWKVNKQVGALENIDLKLRKIERDLKTRAEEEPQQETTRTRAAPVKEATEAREPEKERYAKGKSGKIYTEAELEALIRD